jgi:hypothetical protein
MYICTTQYIHSIFLKVKYSFYAITVYVHIHIKYHFVVVINAASTSTTLSEMIDMHDACVHVCVFEVDV